MITLVNTILNDQQRQDCVRVNGLKVIILFDSTHNSVEYKSFQHGGQNIVIFHILLHKIHHYKKLEGRIKGYL